MRRVAQVAAVAVVLGLLGILVWDLVHQSGGKVAREVDSGKPIEAPAFTRPRVDRDGTLSLASLRGQVVVLNFWQSYCAPCSKEAATLAAAARRWEDRNVVFVGVDELDLRGPAKKFIERYGITYPIVSDDGPLVGHYGVTGYPETFIVDRHGRVVPPHIVGPVTRDGLDRAIQHALTL
jgi:cytochrome c biogenesis protein CcmG/thiol:disulfide interchange protein DsbE